MEERLLSEEIEEKARKIVKALKPRLEMSGEPAAVRYLVEGALKKAYEEGYEAGLKEGREEDWGRRFDDLVNKYARMKNQFAGLRHALSRYLTAKNEEGLSLAKLGDVLHKARMEFEYETGSHKKSS